MGLLLERCMHVSVIRPENTMTIFFLRAFLLGIFGAFFCYTVAYTQCNVMEISGLFIIDCKLNELSLETQDVALFRFAQFRFCCS